MITKCILGAVALMACGCAGTMKTGGVAPPTTVTVRSYHEEAMDVYALCGDHDGTRLGTVGALGEAEFAPARSDMTCATGIRFAMVPQGRKSGGYVTEAVAVMPRHIDLLIEKYPALSYWRVR